MQTQNAQRLTWAPDIMKWDCGWIHNSEHDSRFRKEWSNRGKRISENGRVRPLRKENTTLRFCQLVIIVFLIFLPKEDARSCLAMEQSSSKVSILIEENSISGGGRYQSLPSATPHSNSACFLTQLFTTETPPFASLPTLHSLSFSTVEQSNSIVQTWGYAYKWPAKSTYTCMCGLPIRRGYMNC